MLIFFCSNIVFGQYTPTLPPTNQGWGSLGNMPFGGNTTPYSEMKTQYILLASDLASGGMVTNDVLTSIGFYVSGGTTKTYYGLTINIKHTTATSINAFDGTGLTLVYQANPTVTNTPGWKDFTFSNSFTWNGINNILVSICWSAGTSLGVKTHYAVTSLVNGPNRSYSHRATSGIGCYLTGTGGGSTVVHTRFGIKPKISSFTPVSVCASSNQTVTITGKYFTGTTAVSIGGTAASSYTVNSDTQITAEIGVGSTGPISVTTPRGTGVSSSSLTVKSQPVVTASPSIQSLCSGSSSSVLLSSNVVGTSFSWFATANSNINGESTSAQNSSIIDDNLTNSSTSAATVNYTITPTASGCTGAAISVPITVNPYPTATASPNPQTTCSNVSTGVNLISDVIGTTFSWLTASNANVSGESTTAQSGASIIDNLINTSTSPVTLNYTITPTAIGCTGTSITVPITVEPMPTVNADPSAVTICSGLLPGITFTGNLSGTTFSWSTIANSNVGGESITVQTGTSITDLLTNATSSPITLNYTITPEASGCTGPAITVPITVNPSLASISTGDSTIICENSSVLLVANTGIDLNYQWQLNNSPIAGQNNSTLVVDSTGNYSVSVLNNFNCSSTSNTIPVTVNTNPLAPIISVNSPTLFCQGDSIVLSVTNDPSMSYQWQNNGTNILNATSNQLTAYNSGFYLITATNADNCSTVSSTESVTVYPLPSSDINILNNAPFCEGDSVILQGSYISNGMYIWSNQGGILTNADSSTFITFDSGSYSYQIIDTNNCSNQSDTINIIINSHNTSEIYTSSLGPYTLNGTTYSESGVYIQNILTANGCDSTITLNLIVEEVGIDGVETNDQNILLFPNPVVGNKVYIITSPSENFEVLDVTNLMGQKIKFELHDQMIELLTNESGIYYFHLIKDKQSLFISVVINE